MKNMKKIFGMIMAIAMVLSCIMVASAASTANVSVGSAEAQPGDFIEIAYTVEDATYATYSMVLDYDASALELQSVTKGEMSQGGVFSANTNPESPKCGTVSYITDVNCTGNGVLFTATFKVVDTATSGVYPVGAKNASFNAADASLLTVAVEAGEVSIHAHTWVYHEAVAPTCYTDGNIAYYQCSGCGAAKTENGIPLGRYGWVQGAAHDFVEYAAVEPTCTTEGNIAYKQCSICGHAEDMNGVHLSKDRWVLGVKHSSVVEVAATAPTCTTEGNIAYWYCEDCGYAESVDGKPLSKYGWVLGPWHANVVKVEAVAPTCDTEGNVGYWYCEDCGYIESEDGMPLSKYGWILGATGHDWVFHAAVEPTCETEGNVAYYQCSVCGAAKTEDGIPLSKYGWILGATGHVFEDGVCVNCGKEESPKTGDAAGYIVAMSAMLAAAGLFLASKKGFCIKK